MFLYGYYLHMLSSKWKQNSKTEFSSYLGTYLDINKFIAILNVLIFLKQ